MEEHFDVLNSDGSHTGKSKPRSEVHRDGDWHKAINLWIINSNKELLIQKRASVKDTYPDLWDLSCCGHISAGENSETTVIRETKEELGIDIKEGDFKFILNIFEQHVLNGGTFFDNEFRDIFILDRNIPLEEFTLQESEVAEIKWMPLLEFQKQLMEKPQNFVPHDLEYTKIFPILIDRYSL